MVKGSCGQTFTAFEDHVFEEVSDTGLSGLLAQAACLTPELQAGHRCISQGQQGHWTTVLQLALLRSRVTEAGPQFG
jgi:hypothetical protein